MVDFNKMLEEHREKRTMTINTNPFGAPDTDGEEKQEAAENADIFEVEVPAEEGGGGKYQVKDDDYPARLTDLTKDTSNAGNPMFVWEYELLWPSNVRGKTFRNYTALTPAAMWKLTETLAALDLSKPAEPAAPGVPAKPARVKFKKEEAVGRYAILSMVTEVFKGESRSSIRRVSPMSPAQQAKLKELLGTAGGPPVPGAEGTERKSHAAEDDIPF